jgi:hypothetical protein
MFTDILAGLGSMLAGGLVALVPFAVWSCKMEPAARRTFGWIFLIWGALWIGPGIRQSIDYLR